MPPDPPRCVPHLKPERRDPPAAGRQYSHAVPQLVSRLGSCKLERHGFVSALFSYHTYLALLCYDLILLLSFAPMYSPARPTVVCCMYVLL